MRRRDFIQGIAGSAIAWPLAARAQQERRVGILMPGPESDAEQQTLVAIFQQTLRELGWNEGQNLAIYLRWGAAQAQNIVALDPEVILAYPTSVLIQLRRETSTIPIVFVGVSDPLAQGIVTSLARPTGNITGFSNPSFSLVGKALQMLKDIAPNVSRIALIISADNGSAPAFLQAFNTLSPSLAITPVTVVYKDGIEIKHAIEELASQPNGGLFFPRDTNTRLDKDLIVQLAAQHNLPAVYAQREMVTAGGLMSYGIDQVEAFRSAASYVDRILRGAKPSDLPIQEPTRFQLVINFKTAKSLGLTVPLGLRASADEVIE